LENADGGGHTQIAALLVVDSRHPGLDKDVEAWRWLGSIVGRGGIVATKIDKLARGQRIRAQREFESAFDGPVLPISAATGEGLDELWKLIDRLAHKPDPKPRSRRQRPRPAAPLPRK
jgi:GTP-binding protein EngB required for normal cell division